MDALYDWPAFLRGQSKPREDSPELKAAIATAQLRAMKDAEKIAWELLDVASDPWHQITNRRAHAPFLDALLAGDDAQFGILLAKQVRLRVKEAAADEAREAYEQAHEGEQA